MGKKKDRKDGYIRVRGVHRQQVDVRKLGKAVIALAVAQAEADAEAEQRRRKEAKSGDAS